jgi:hypothetical protein
MTASVLRGGIPALTERLFSALDFPIRVEVEELRPARSLYVLEFACIMADEKAIKQMTGAKGAGSYHPSVCSANIVGRLEVHQVRPPFQHYTCSDPSLFDVYTFERFDEMCRQIQDAHDHGAPGEGERMETSLGIGFHAGRSIPFSPRAPLYRIPECVYWDAMHTLWASGGISQYEANQFLHGVVRNGVRLDMLQNFIGTIVLPGGNTNNRRFRFCQRLVAGDNKHIRAFAGEMLMLVPCLILFSDMVLVPAGVMEPQVACMRLLFTIQVVIMAGDRAADIVDFLDELIWAHHDLYLGLYRACAKPKLHYLRDLPRIIKAIRRVVTCFLPSVTIGNRKQLPHGPFGRLGSQFSSGACWGPCRTYRIRICTNLVCSVMSSPASTALGRIS